MGREYDEAVKSIYLDQVNRHLAEIKRTRELLFETLCQFGSYVDTDGTEYYAAHLSVLEDIFEYFGLRPNQRYTAKELQEKITLERS